MAAPQLLQRPVMLATKLSTPLTPAAPIHQVRIVNGQPCGKTGSTPLTGIVITTPVSAAPTRLASPAQAPNPSPIPIPTPAQPIQISSLTTEPKVGVLLKYSLFLKKTKLRYNNLIIELITRFPPQPTVKLAGGAEQKAVVSLPSSSTPPLSPPPRPKKEESPEVCVGAANPQSLHVLDILKVKLYCMFL